MADDLLASGRRLGLVGDETVPVEPLTGGVSSDIFEVTTDDRAFVVKRALARLKVVADWRAPIERNHFEAALDQQAVAVSGNPLRRIA